MSNQLKRILFIKLLFIFILCFYSNISLAENSPSVQLNYAYLFDPVCSKNSSYRIDPKIVKELNNRLPDWQSNWNQEGNLLLKNSNKNCR